jgi:hypothetical protein
MLLSVVCCFNCALAAVVTDCLIVAGADLSELVNITTADAYQNGWLFDLASAFESFRKPVIAAVRGFAVGAPQDKSSVHTDEMLSLAEGSSWR